MPKLGIGVVGCGGIATANHLPAIAALSDACELIAVCDPDSIRRSECATKYGCAACETHEELLSNDRIGAVIVATPNIAHVGPVLAALESGRHVLCEKPLGMNAEEAAAMCEAAKRNHRVLQVGLQLRFTPVGRQITLLAESGRFGHVYYARAQALRRRGVPGWGVFIDREKQGGGPLLDLGVHILDLALLAMGYPEPMSATGAMWDYLGKDPALFNAFGEYDRTRFTIEDMAAGFVRFQNGAALSVECSFMANLAQTVYETQWFGTKAGGIAKPMDSSLWLHDEERRQLRDVAVEMSPDVEDAHVAALRAFASAIESGGPSPVPGEHGLILNRIIDDIYRSAMGK